MLKVAWSGEPNPGSLITQYNGFFEQRDVHVALVLVDNVQLLPHIATLSVLHGPQEVWVLEGEEKLALVLALALLETVDDILGYVCQLGSSKPQAMVLLVHILLEVHAEFTQSLIDGLGTISLGAGSNTKTHADVKLVILSSSLLLSGSNSSFVFATASTSWKTSLRMEASKLNWSIDFSASVEASLSLNIGRDGLVEVDNVPLDAHLAAIASKR